MACGGGRGKFCRVHM
ncbi:unnamed protein product, partial [Rotaria magnacalcarata]